MIITTGFTDLSAEAHRNQTAALLSTTTTLDPFGTPFGITTIGGVQSGFALTGGATLTGTIQPGRAIVPSSTPEQGAYVVTMTEPEDVYFEPGDGTYTRFDLVYLQIDELPEPLDPEEEPPAEPEYVPGASIKVLKGAGVTGTTTPTIPATPANALPLWAVKIKNTTTEATGFIFGNAVDQRKRALLANQDRQPFSMAAGWAVKTCRGQDTFTGPIGITFPAGRFRTTPIVTATLQTAAGGSAKWVPRVINVTPLGASIYLYTGDGEAAGTTGTVHNVTIGWTAVQMSEDKSNS